MNFFAKHESKDDTVEGHETQYVAFLYLFTVTTAALVVKNDFVFFCLVYCRVPAEYLRL